MNLMHFVQLQKSLGQRIAEGHPWIYRDALKPHSPYPNGSQVRILGPTKDALAVGIYDNTSPIAVRIYRQSPTETADKAFLHSRLQQALNTRLRMFDESTTAYRLCNGEGDGLPGLVIDRYGSVLVVQYDGQGIAQFWQPQILSLLQNLSFPFPIKSIFRKDRFCKGDLLWGAPIPQEIQILEYSTPLWVNIIQGQKTGLFLDQRDNRLLLRRYTRGQTVWNGFAYTGGFSVQAALGNASRVVSVDMAKEAIETAKRNFLLNHMPLENHGFYAEDAFVHMRKAIASRVQYEVVVVDPPSFAPSEASLGKALSGYRQLFSLALQMTRPEGLFVASSCSSHVTQDSFLQVCTEAAQATKRQLQLLEWRGQPADHPSIPAFSEGRYLKFAIFACFS